MKTAPIYIDDSGALTPPSARPRPAVEAREGGLGLIVVDYLQLMQVPGTKENRATEISEISRSLKHSPRTPRAVIALSQLNAASSNARQEAGHVGPARVGAIEQDAT